MFDPELKKLILEKTAEYYRRVHIRQPFLPGQSKLSYGGRVFDEKELINLVDASLDFWLTYGDWSRKFEKNMAAFIGVRHCALVNSGSSANLLAFMALTSDLLGDRRIRRDDEVITVAAGFPTTVAPIVQFGAIPVFVDVDPETYNVDVSLLEKAWTSRTKAVVLAHTLGNPFDIDSVKEFCHRRNLWLIEDNCDALGSLYDGRPTGSFGDLATSSFYPPHHMTMGEGGAVYTQNLQLSKVVDSLRDWGRDCWCPSGKDNTCQKRFGWKLGDLPLGYDHKYIYSHFGYNLKATDLQAAVGCAQLEKLPSFVLARQRNHARIMDGLKGLEEYFVLPKATPKSDPSWFGFLLTVRESAGFSRDSLVQHLEGKNIQTRMLFAGNLTRHPCFDEMRRSGQGYRVVGELTITDRIMRESFWLGVYPGMDETMVDYMIDSIRSFIPGSKKAF
jgi:CDP-6-deoxy-D-xylo-4-hexulose-3-dehydrase